MGLYDRDYYRNDSPSFLGSFRDRGIVTKWLLGINLFAFLIQILSYQPGQGEGSFTRALSLNLPDLMHGEVWRLFTFAFIHPPRDIFGIVFNMLFLWWLGHAIEDIYGSREFLCFYLTAILASAISFLVAVKMRAYPSDAATFGANGPITAILLLYACHYPGQIILIMFVLPVPIWLFAGFAVLKDMLHFFGHYDGVAAVCHIGAAAFALLYYRFHLRISPWIPDLTNWRKRWNRPKLRLYREKEPLQPAGVSASLNPDEDQLEAKMDAILEKISRTGKESLTEGEREVLLRERDLSAAADVAGSGC